MKKWQELSKKAKVGFVSGATVVLIGGTAGAVKVNADHQYRDQKNEITKKLATASEKGELAQKVSQLVDKEGFLKKDLTSEEVTKLRAELSSLSDEVKDFVTIRDEKVSLSDVEELTQQLSAVEKKLTVESQLKEDISAYDGWLNSGTDVKKLVISDAATTKSLEKVTKTFGDLDSVKDSWTKKVDEILKATEKQLSDVTSAEKLVDALYKDKKVIKDVKRADYEKAVKAVKGLARKSDKDALNKKLDPVKKVIEEREKAEKAKKEAEAKKKAEAEAAEKAKADAAAKEKAEANKEVASANDTETANQPASDQKTDSDWSDSNAGSDWSGSSNTGNNTNWGSGSSSNQGATTGGNQSSGNSGGGSTNTGGNNNQSSGGSSNNGSGSNGGNSGSTGGNNSGGSSNGGSNGGFTGGNSGSDGGTTDAEMEADGWIKAPYPIESDKFWDWLFDNGYYGYFQSGEWIQPY